MSGIMRFVSAANIYDLVHDHREEMSQEDIDEACELILTASGDVAWVIFCAKSASWWNQDIDTTCKTILDAPGDVALAIFCAKEDNWWNQDHAATCKAIIDNGGNTPLINRVRVAGWWIDPTENDPTID